MQKLADALLLCLVFLLITAAGSAGNKLPSVLRESEDAGKHPGIKPICLWAACTALLLLSGKHTTSKPPEKDILSDTHALLLFLTGFTDNETLNR